MCLFIIYIKNGNSGIYSRKVRLKRSKKKKNTTQNFRTKVHFSFSQVLYKPHKTPGHYVLHSSPWSRKLQPCDSDLSTSFCYCQVKEREILNVKYEQNSLGLKVAHAISINLSLAKTSPWLYLTSGERWCRGLMEDVWSFIGGLSLSPNILWFN